MDVNNEYLCLLQKCLENENLKRYEVSFSGKAENCDGYMGTIIFVTVNGITSENEKKVLNWAIKHGTKNLLLRQTIAVKEAFETEIFVYDKLFPALKEFQLERKIREPFESVPKCYKTLILDNMEILILDNLKKQGFELHDRMKPFNLSHLKFVLKEYGKLHALSFALKDQRYEEFKSLAAQCTYGGLKPLISNDGIMENYRKVDDTILDILRRRNDLSLSEKYKNLLQKNSARIIVDIIDEIEPQAVFAHGDCWSNNFMFKYEDGDKTSPTKVAILDWQGTALLSPVCDLSYFIYLSSSSEELDKLEELLKYYYASFSTFLTLLGSSPEELFPYDALKRHWKKYSVYGMMLTPLVMQYILCKQEDAPVFENLEEGENFEDKMNLDVSENTIYYERVKSVLDHHFTYTF